MSDATSRPPPHLRVGVSASTAAPQSWPGTVWVAIRPDAPFHALVGLYLAAAVILHFTTGYPRVLPSELSWTVMLSRTVTYALPAFVSLMAWQMLRRGRSLRCLRTWSDGARLFFAPGATLRFVLLFVMLPPFLTVFVAMKASIPDVVPFIWDPAFMRADELLHFGHHPWELLHDLLGRPAMTGIIDAVYIFWFPVIAITVLWQAWHGSHFSDAREQFLLSFAACWILIGTILATALSSAGPVYYEAVVNGANPFAPLMDYLHVVDGASELHALRIQETLWSAYQAREAGDLAAGISAMPSMHVSLAVLMVLMGFRVNRWVGFAYGLYALFIMVGSVHLGWHYAVDGYVAALLTVLIWIVSGRATSKWSRESAVAPGGEVVLLSGPHAMFAEEPDKERLSR